MKLVSFVLALLLSLRAGAVDVETLRTYGEDHLTTIYIFTSPSCPHCAAYHEDILPYLKKNISDKHLAQIKLVDMVGDRRSLKVVELARCMENTPYEKVKKAFFISPVVDMEKLILGMMDVSGISEERLRNEKIITSPFGETLSWEYLCYVRENPVRWTVPTHILYGEKDNLTDMETVSAFAERTGASLTVMKDGEHWFHTPEQMAFLDRWIQRTSLAASYLNRSSSETEWLTTSL